MSNKPLVSVIVTTKNEARDIRACLVSIKNQSFKNIEIIVVDNNSKDETKKIAYEFTKLVFNKGPERSSQRNFGAKKAKGDFLLFIDADMKLSPRVIEECVNKIKKYKAGGLIIPEESYGVGFWAECKNLERSFYLGIDWIEAARFFDKKKFWDVGGFDESLTGPEDWDLSQKVKKKYGLERIKNYIFHSEGRLSLADTVKKKYYYSKKIGNYSKLNRNKSFYSKQASILRRYGIFFSDPHRLFKNPLLGLGVIVMKACEFAAGAVGYASVKLNKL